MNVSTYIVKRLLHRHVSWRLCLRHIRELVKSIDVFEPRTSISEVETSPLRRVLLPFRRVCQAVMMLK